MGHGNSKAASEAIKKLSSLELQNIKAVFHELSTENKDGTRAIPEPNMATRRVFAERFSLPGLIGERLFHAFDRDNNGTINLEEFVGGVALCLHGSAHAKCDLLFRMFNFSDEEENAVTEDELKTVLLSSLQSAHTILDTVDDSGETTPKDQEKPLVETVSEIVEDAFKTCDKSKDGKLSAKEFSTWLHKNPKIMDNVFGWQCPKPELGQWANEESTSPTEKTTPVKTLQDLFEGGQNQSFFDTLGASTEVEKPSSPKEPNPDPSKNNEPPQNSGLTESGLIKQTETLLKLSNSTEVLNTNTDMPIYGQYDQYSAMWLPSAETSSFLLAIQNGMVKPDNIKLTSMAVPCLAIDTPILDPVKDLMSKFCNEQDQVKREVPTELTVAQNECGLRQLLRAECWRAALNLIGKLLAKDIHITSVSEVTHSPQSLEMWFCRIALLFKLKMFNHAEVELQAFGNLDSPKMYYEFYPDLYQNQKGSMVPFAFRVLAALLPQHNGRPKESLDKLFYIHSVCCNIIKTLQAQNDTKPGVELWKTRLLAVLYYIGNTFVSIKEYRLAIHVFEQIVKVDVDNSQALLSGLGRISLQSGDIEKAQFYFKSVEDLVTQSGSSQTDVLINRGLLALTLDAYEEAYKHFLAVRNLDPGNAVAVNNAAVSLLFQGRLKEALELLEDIVLKNPENLQEGILFNICTMYELETSHHIQKKQKILDLIAKYKGDGFNVSCLKFP